MASPVLFSSRVIADIQALPEQDRIAVASAIAAKTLLGIDPKDSLSPLGNIVYTMIQNTITRDTARYQRSLA